MAALPVEMPDLKMLTLFGCGAMLLRGAGCTVNDLIDRDIDVKPNPGTYCGSCYGAEVADDDGCNSCEEVKEAYRKKGWGLSNPELIDQCTREGFFTKVKEEEGEGCNVKGFVDVSKVAGNFHFAAGKVVHHSQNFLSDLLEISLGNYNISHKINELSFGDFFPGLSIHLTGLNGRNILHPRCISISLN